MAMNAPEIKLVVKSWNAKPSASASTPAPASSEVTVLSKPNTPSAKNKPVVTIAIRVNAEIRPTNAMFREARVIPYSMNLLP